MPPLSLPRAARAALAVALLAGCASVGGRSLAVESDWDPSAPFASLSTWDWLPAAPLSGDLAGLAAPVADALLRDAVGAELVARGYPRGAPPTFWVHPLASIEDVVAVEAQAYYAQVPPWMRDALRDTHAIIGQRGVLVVDLIDPATRLPFWRGAVSGAVDRSASPEARTRRLREAARRLLARFPPQR